MRLRTIHKVLLIVVLVLYVLSVTLILLIGYSPWIALTWSLMTFIGADFPIDFSLPDKANPLAFLSNILSVVGSLIITILLTSLFYQLLSKINISEKIMLRRVSALKNHIVIYPANRIARYLAEELKRNRLSFVILDPSIKNVQAYRSEGMLAIKGDAIDPSSLEKVRLKNAAGLILLSEDKIKNALAAIAARKINDKIRLAARVRSIDDIGKMKRISINYIIMPEVAVGDEIGNFLLMACKTRKA
ncbi:MAG: potassium channel family protein [Candidatus Micrarchaeia archaeon]|jgi:voltage-gated potassium channel Kch